jgi:hypothetical protein
MSADLRLALLWCVRLAVFLAYQAVAVCQPRWIRATRAASTSASKAASSPCLNVLDHNSSPATIKTTSRPIGWARSTARADLAVFTSVNKTRSAGRGVTGAGRPGVHAMRRAFRDGAR